MKRHLLRDLELGLHQPVQVLDPQGKERPSAREQKKLAALCVPSLMGTALWHLAKELRAALLTRLTLSPTKGAHSCRSKVKPGGHCSTSLLGLAGYKAGHMQTYNVAWPRTEGKYKCGSNPRQVSQ